MRYLELQDRADLYAGALLLDGLIAARTRRTLQISCASLSALAFLSVIGGSIVWRDQFAQYAHFFVGSCVVFAAGWVVLTLLNAFYHSYFFLDISTTLRERGIGDNIPLSFDVARMVSGTDADDATLAFIRSDFGLEVLVRLGLRVEDLEPFLAARTTRPDVTTLEFGTDMVTAPRFAEVVYQSDKAFAEFLFTHAIQEKDLVGACAWVGHIQGRAKQQERWWGKDALGRIPGIGKQWSYGQTHDLEQFSTILYAGESEGAAATTKEVDQLENVLVRARGANALIVADLGSGEMDIIYGLLERIRSGTVLPQLESKRVLQFRAGAVIDAAQGDKTAFETAFMTILNEAIHAGDVILLFEDLPSLIENARTIGTDLASLLGPYLTSSSIQIIATSDKGRYHETIEQNATLSNDFEVIRVTEKDAKLLVSILEDEVPRTEAETGVVFTYQAVEALAESVGRYFADAVPLEKAKDLLEEIPVTVQRSGKTLITREDVQSLVATKTGVPQEGTVDDVEKEKLLNLEATLHEHVIGQNEAIEGIANTMRRARAGLRNPNRPLGSFLFLGPTGVGKTETAKALEEVFFGAELPMLRLDMSEYSDAGALERLIGSFNAGKTGTLVSLLRDQQYGVLLLDEFEKASDDVHNLFLQVLDEGMFSDAQGKKVNARNTIIIATSNAGSARIFSLVSEGKDLAHEKDAFVTALIDDKIFRPELINRFDGVILFHPLQREQMTEIAMLQVKKLASRLATQGLKLSTTPELVDYLIRNGFDEKFGARSMNRVLQENVEKLLAESLIRGDIKTGSTVQIVSSPDAPDTLSVQVL